MFLQTSQKYYLDLAVELQLLAGAALTLNEWAHPAGASFNTGLLVGSAGYNRIDIVAVPFSKFSAVKKSRRAGSF